ncbi:coiled-coil domain-containing protein 55-domain containing protein [Scleroderma yunnanense]
MKLSFSLANKSTKAAAPPLKPPTAFASLDDDSTVDDAQTTENRHVAANKNLLAQTSKAAQKRLDQELKVDPTVYQYDEIWDRMQDAKQRQKEAKEVDAKVRKPKYIEGLLTSAATRRLDRLRAEEKMLQHEREMEGDQFVDKEAFVTQAYKDQMAEVRKAEEEEKQREEAEKKKTKSTTGMAYFYRTLLANSEKQHEEAMAAASAPKPIARPQGASPNPNLTISKPPEMVAKSDLELARLAQEEGKDVELNDDNQIVDKRELLSAGLNLAAPNTRRLGLQHSTTKASRNPDQPEALAHRAVGSMSSRKEINERRAREVQRQLEEERERLLKEREEAEEAATQRIAQKRNTDTDIQDARSRYLERKRQRLEESTQTTVVEQ